MNISDKNQLLWKGEKAIFVVKYVAMSSIERVRDNWVLTKRPADIAWPAESVPKTRLSRDTAREREAAGAAIRTSHQNFHK